MDRVELYTQIADRKFKPKDMEPYDGNNGRVNKCVNLMRAGKIRTGGTILDVGGGIGDLGYAVRDLFDKRIVLDISVKNLECAHAKGNDIFLCDVDSGGFTELYDHDDALVIENNSIDTITALDFIEHIIDPEYFASECFRVLKPSGEVFVNTPNIRFWRHVEQLISVGTFPHTSGDREVFHGGHLAFFTYTDLRMIFESVGFVSVPQIKDEEGYETPPDWIIEKMRPKNQAEYMSVCMEFGCPNLLYKAIKP